VTFNSEQQRLIDDMLEAERRKNGSLERFFDDDLQEPLFVKNLESVQGDERDIVYFSTTYGPDQTGRVSMNFGPLNKDGGERRLNVAVTRARHELRVFTSLLPDQIDITRTNAVGVKDLKLFLDFAKRGPRAFLEEIHGNGGDFESPLEKAVAAALCQKGWQVHPQIGVSCFRIDLGVLDPDLPGRYLAAVECDGATYHRSATARDRDKLRERVLRGLGWEVLRVWSTEWWTSRERAVGRLHEQLTRLLSAARIRRAEKTEEPKQAVQVQDKLKPSTENEELPIRGQTVVETREKRKGYSVEQSGLGQLRANFEKKPVVASPAHPQKSQVINPDSIHQKPVPEHPLRGKEVEKKEKDPDIPKISPFRQPVDYRSVADPFSETVMTLLPDDRKHCPARHDRMALLFGMYGPYLKCSKCDEMGEIPYQTLFETLSKLQSPCEKCGWPMLRVLPGKVLAGCSHCKHTEPWKVLAIRLRHK
jgi:very-short-patch-repair endonuclease